MYISLILSCPLVFWCINLFAKHPGTELDTPAFAWQARNLHGANGARERRHRGGGISSDWPTASQKPPPFFLGFTLRSLEPTKGYCSGTPWVFHLRQVHQTVVFPAPYPESAPCVVALPLKKLVALPIFNTDDLTPWEHILSQAHGISTSGWPIK